MPAEAEYTVQRTPADPYFVKKAAKINAKAAAELPLFAGDASRVSPNDLYWKWRRDVANGANGMAELYSQGTRGLAWIALHKLERFCASIVGEHFAGLQAYSRRVYPAVSYYQSFWFNVLQGQRVVYAWRCERILEPREIDLGGGRKTTLAKDKLVEVAAFQLAAPLTRAELDTLFPPIAGPGEMDDGGLAELLAAVTS